MKQIVIVFAALSRAALGAARANLINLKIEGPVVIRAVETARAEVINAAIELGVPQIWHELSETWDEAGETWDRMSARLGCAFRGEEFKDLTYAKRVALRKLRQKKAEMEMEKAEDEAEKIRCEEEATQRAKDELELEELIKEFGAPKELSGT